MQRSSRSKIMNEKLIVKRNSGSVLNRDGMESGGWVHTMGERMNMGESK